MKKISVVAGESNPGSLLALATSGLATFMSALFMKDIIEWIKIFFNDTLSDVLFTKEIFT